MSKPRVVLGLEEFKALVSGKEVDKDGAVIILSDIGYAQMSLALVEAMTESGVSSTPTS
jgi:hypothetical protein